MIRDEQALLDTVLAFPPFLKGSLNKPSVSRGFLLANDIYDVPIVTDVEGLVVELRGLRTQRID